MAGSHVCSYMCLYGLACLNLYVLLRGLYMYVCVCVCVAIGAFNYLELKYMVRKLYYVYNSLASFLPHLPSLPPS